MSDESSDDVLVYEPSKVSWVTAEFVRKPPMWMARAFIFGVTTMLIVLVVYASLAQTAIHIDARGALTTEPAILPIVVPSSFRVAAIKVHEQQLVQKGDVLIVAEDESDADLDRIRTRVAVAKTQGTLDPGLLAELREVEERHARQAKSVVAPISGIVHQIAVRGVGEVINERAEVLQIIPKDAQFVAVLAVANKDISRVSVGLPVIIRLDAFPERTHGAINGIVESVPLSLTTSGDPTVPPAYMVVVRVDRQSYVKGKQEFPFRSGMQLEGRVVTRHESMLVNFIHKLFSISDELG